MDIDDSPLARLLRTHRSGAELTQEELAERAGVSARTVSDVERGLRTRIYPDTASRLADALGLEEPDRAHFETLARGRTTRPLGPNAWTPLEAMPEHAGGLPEPPTRLVGRERELEVILGFLADPEIRLVTLTGPGGVGKTRLAIEAARRAKSLFSGGIHFVSLAEAREPGLVPSLIAHALGVKGPSEPVIDALVQRLAERDTVVVLDTFEQVIDAARTIADLLSAAPRLTVLVTSREILRIRAERELAVPPLELPPSGAALGADALRYPAVRLFVDRAGRTMPELTLDDESAELVVDICRRVGGLPLAIELAAARVKHLPLAALRDHLGHRLAVLTGGPRDLTDRHRAMRDTIAWSYDLLDETERATLQALSVFAGGWTLPAAARVCALSEDDMLARCSALLDKSLVHGAGMPNDEPRYRMLDVVREYATERREDDPQYSEALLRRYAEYHLELAEAGELAFGREEQEESFAILETEHDNLRAALRWSIERGEADVALRMSGALWRFWMSEGHHVEGRSWLGQALVIEPPGATRARIKALWGAAWLAFHQGDYAEMNELSLRLTSAAHGDADRVDVRNALTIEGMVAMAQGRYVDALPPLEEALEICRQSEPGWLLATSGLNLGMAYLQAGEHDAARAHLEEARELYERLGDRRFTARSIQQLGFVALTRNRRDEARSLIATSLQAYRELGDRSGIAEGLEGLAACDAADGMAERAARIAGAAEALRERLATRPLPFDRAFTDRFLAAARDSLDQDTWQAAWDEGRDVPLEDSIEYSLTARSPG